MYKPWEQDVIGLRAEGISWAETAAEISRRYPEMDIGEMKLIRSCRAVMERYTRPTCTVSTRSRRSTA